jgi:protein-S-isoprenylcysteine O-methyltransferase Ste14
MMIGTMPLYRIGDLLLSALWIVMAIGTVFKVSAAIRQREWAVAAHHGINAMILLLIAALFVLRAPSVRQNEGWLPRIVAIVGTWMLPVVSVLPLTWTPEWLIFTTSVVMVGISGWLLWSAATLSRSFSIFPEARALIRRGPYGIVRHPLYAGYILLYICLLLPRISLLAIIGIAVAIGCEIWRARYEENVLRQAFPDYEDYAAVTPRFVPGLRAIR